MHVVDLDGARAKQPRQHDTIRELALSAPLKLQVAGGFRSIDDVRRMLDAGAARVVIGSLAIREPRVVSRVLDLFGPEELALALDVKLIDGEPIVVTAGWTENSGVTLYDAAARFPAGCHLLLTDVGRDGMMKGCNIDATVDLARATDIPVIASGGVRGIADIHALNVHAKDGIEGVICGRAIYDGSLDLRPALAVAE